jgi:hypothetical protein
MSSKALRKISKDHRPSKINAFGKTAHGASGSTIIPGGAYMIPMEWKKIRQQVQVYKSLSRPQSWALMASITYESLT